MGKGHQKRGVMAGDRRSILYILASPAWGGGEQYVCDLMKALPERGYDCYAVTAGQPNAARMSGELPSDRLYSFKPGSLFDIASARRIARIIKEQRIDIVHVNKFSDAFLAVWARKISRRNIRVVMTRHLIRKGKKGFLYEYLYGQLDRLVFVSELAKSEFMSRNPKIDSGKVCVVHNGVSDRPQDASLRSHDTVTIAFAGRLNPEKGIDILIKALAKLSGYAFRLKLIGNGEPDYVDGLKRTVANHGIENKVEFTGFTDDVNSALREASVGVLPSIVREGFPMAVLEYMRSGLAVVASHNGGQAECLTDGENALLVPPGDVENLSNALESLLSDLAKRRAMGAAARKTYEKGFTYDIFLQKMIDIYEGL